MSDILTLLLLLWFLLIPPSPFGLTAASLSRSQFLMHTVAPAEYIFAASTNTSKHPLASLRSSKYDTLMSPKTDCEEDEAEMVERISREGGPPRSSTNYQAVRRDVCRTRRYKSFEDVCLKVALGGVVVVGVCWHMLRSRSARL